MRYPPRHKHAVRAAIVAAASRALRRDGLAGVSVASLMGEVGLTHGGFYRPFAELDELVSAAVSHAADSTAASVLTERRGLDGVLAAYLSADHVRQPSDGCVLAALGSEARSLGGEARRAFDAAAQGFFARLDALLAHAGSPAPSEQPSDAALELASRLVGAVVLARLLSDEALVARLLSAARGRTTSARPTEERHSP